MTDEQKAAVAWRDPTDFGGEHQAEFERLTEAMGRYEDGSIPEDEIEDDEYGKLSDRWAQLRRMGYGPQPHHLDD